MSNPGFRIYNDIKRPSKEWIEAFSEIPVANIADNMNRSFCIGGSIRPYNTKPLAGSAFTVKTRPGDNLLLNKAIDQAIPGDVIIVEGQGSLTNALMGDLMAEWAHRRGIAGLIIDGAIRNAEDIKTMDIPVYAVGVTPAGPYKSGPGEINTPISCGGVQVSPGDILIGDQDGIVVINPKDATDLLENSRATMLKEGKMLNDIKNGSWDRDWVDRMLQEKGCEVIHRQYMD